WARVADVALPAGVAGLEFSGMTDAPGGRFATAEDRSGLIRLDDGTEHALGWGGFVKEGAEVGGLAFSGVAYAEGRFYVLSETYTCVVVVDAVTFAVEAVFGLEPSAAADLSVDGGLAYVVIDHNYDEPVPPVAVYDLAGALAASDGSDGP
ncbi:MAG: hypothetical protein AAGE65_13320, partial [Planctomycetota bacterium]